MIRVVNIRGLNTAEARAGVVYVGRAFAGWPGHPLANPHRPGPEFDALTGYRAWINDTEPDRLNLLLDDLWEATEDGKKPIGCWCVNATAGDGSRQVCHAQILAELLRERFGCVTCGGTTADA